LSELWEGDGAVGIGFDWRNGMSDKLCPECGHDFEKHGQSNCVKCNCKRSQAEVNLLIARDEWREIAHQQNAKCYEAIANRDAAVKAYTNLFEQSTAQISQMAEAFLDARRERDDAKAHIKLLEATARLRNAQVDEARALARRFYRERNEARRDMANLWHGTYLGADPERDLIDDGFGNITLRWCAHCGGDMQVVRPGQFQCGECGR